MFLLPALDDVLFVPGQIGDGDFVRAARFVLQQCVLAFDTDEFRFYALAVETPEAIAGNRLNCCGNQQEDE